MQVPVALFSLVLSRNVSSEMLDSALVLYRGTSSHVALWDGEGVWEKARVHLSLNLFCVCVFVKCTDLTPDMFERRTEDTHGVSFR